MRRQVSCGPPPSALSSQPARRTRSDASSRLASPRGSTGERGWSARARAQALKALGVMVSCSARRAHTALRAVSAVSAEWTILSGIPGKQAGLSAEAAGAEVCASGQPPPEPPGLGLATLQLYVLSTCLLAVLSACVRVKAQDTALLVSAPTKRRPVNSPSVGFDLPTCAATQVPAHMNSALAANA